MAINYAQTYMGMLDTVVQAELTSADMTAGAGMVKWSGGKTVQIMDMSVAGLKDYSRTGGYGNSQTINTVWTPYILGFDRCFNFLIDAMDEDETGMLVTAGNVIKEIGANQIVPELDSIRSQQVFQAIVNDDVVKYGYYTPVVETVLTTFNTDVSGVRAKVGRSVKLRAKMAESTFAILSNSSQLSKQMLVQQESINGVMTDVYKVNGVSIIPVPDERMKTEYELVSGDAGGYAAKAWAQQINWFIYANEAVAAVEKRNITTVLKKGTHPNGDGDLVQGRLYHDCFVFKSKHNMIHVSLKTATITEFTGVLSTTGLTNITYTLGNLFTNRDKGHEFYYFKGGSAAAKAAPATYNDFDLTGYEKITVATAVADVVTSGYYGALVEVDENGRALRFATLKAAGA